MQRVTRIASIGMMAFILGMTACASRAPQQVRIAVADETFEQQRAYACAEVCAAEHEAGKSGSMLDCMRECPGVEVSENDACTPGEDHAVCYGNQTASLGLGIDDQNVAALRALVMLRELAPPSLRSVALADVN